jgi:transcription elongation factor GreA
MEKEKTKTLLTQQGYEDLKNELDNLINVKRPENIKAIKDARALGDLSENADYDAARNEQAELEGRIKQLEKLLENVEIIDESKQSKDTVGIGSTVEIKYIDDEDDVEEYQIVGSQEADPFAFKISNESPIAKALMTHRVGEIVDVESPNGVYQVEITSIR